MSASSPTDLPDSRAPKSRAAPAPEPSRPHVGVVGLGHMGAAFAGNLIADGFPTTVYDRDEKRAAPLVAEGAAAAHAMSDLAGCAIVVTSLPNDDALASVTLGDKGLIRALPPGAVHVSMSTVSPGLARRLAEQHKLAGQSYVAAPVLGNPDLAHARKLFIMVAGEPSGVSKASPVLERLGQRLFPMGEDPGAANLMKVAGNALTAMTLQGMGEILALLTKGGVDPHLAFDILTGSLFDGKVNKTYGGKILAHRYSPPGMTAPLAVKDLRLALAEAERMAVPMPATSLVHDRLVAVVAHGWADLDWSALGLLAAAEAGLE